ncbi:MAG: gliding motility-associated C-terminal domain-containing protein [Bacteroidia bacterium]|nr:gliding motility-associated C-terminal domain-containing protein [Bacteroidia bacterium]
MRSQTTTLINNPNLISGNPTVTNPNCGICDGTIALAPSGGLSPYTFVWNTTATTSSLSSVCAGVYQVNITDANNCTTPVNVNVSNTNGPTVALDSTDETCFGLNDGTASSIVSGGTAPYQYLWIVGGQSTTSISAQTPASYTLQVQDANNCVTTASITINPASAMQANETSTLPTCGNSNGSITINPSGGSGSGYTISWLPPLLGSANTQTNIAAGSYSVNVTDGNGCTQQLVIPLNNSNAPLINVASDSATCNGLATGTATVTINGSAGPFTTTWSAGVAAGTSVSALGAGNYSVIVTDNITGCLATTNFTIDEPDTLSLSLNSQQQPSCAAVCNGVLTGIPNGGTMPYTYLWSPGGTTASSISNLCAGSYTVAVTDANGCSRSQTTILNNNANLISANPVVTSPTCGQCDGAIVLNASGGNLPYASVVWNQGIPAPPTDVTGLCAGPAQVQITDNLGCTQTLSFPISSATGPTATVAATDETCFGLCDGTATVTAVGGTLPYTFLWLGVAGTTNTQSNLCASGSPYFMETTDALGCIFTSQIDINSPNQMLVTPTVSAPTCGLSDGAISLSISGGSVPYTFSWNPNVSSTSSASALGGGNYIVDISDNNGCVQNFVFPLSSINSPTVTAVVTNVLCGGSCNGSVALTITGGNPAYTILWSDNSANDTITGLCDTTISVTVTDASSCVSASTYTITAPQALQFAIPNLQDPLCNGTSTGSFSTIVVGGTLGFTYAWLPNPPATSTTFSSANIPAGAYTVTVTDANGCTSTQSDTLFDPPTLVLSGVVTDASCSTVPDGAIDLTVTGGTPGYNYQWTNGATTQDLTNVLANNYTVVVADTNACADSLTFTINATVVVNAIVNNDTSLCENDSILLDGSLSTGALTYEWSANGVVIGNTPTLSVLPPVGVPTIYIFIAANGACADTDSVVVNTFALPVVDAGPFTTILILNSAGIGGNPSGPAGSIFDWTPGGSLNDSTIANPVASPTVTTTYTLTVTNSNGCSSSDTVTVRVLPQIVFPNGFTPNNDGKNDVWIIDNITLFPECEVEVYNRWGERLFYSRGYTTPWDGNYKGKPLPVGTYYYAIKLNSDFFPDPFVGPITILR